jgi:hypothetical protein
VTKFIVASLFAIVVCGATGGVIAWAIVNWLGIDGTTGAILAALLGTALATGVFIGIVAMTRALRKK